MSHSLFELLNASIMLYFGVLPLLILIISKHMFKKLEPRLLPSDVANLQQRFTRACMAITFVCGGVKMLTTQPGFWSSLLLSK
jgi:hypothetical protein